VIPEISGATLRDLFAGKYRDKFDHFVVVDCRYVYEYTVRFVVVDCRYLW